MKRREERCTRFAGENDIFFRTAWYATVTGCRRELGNVARIAKSLLRFFRRVTKATRKEEEGALFGGSLAPTAPVDSRNIFARLTESLGRRLLVRPIDVWARLLSDLLLALAFVLFRSDVRRSRLTLLEWERRLILLLSFDIYWI